MEKLSKEEMEEQGLLKDPFDYVGDMKGPYDYTKDEVDSHVAQTTGNGNYRTGKLNKKGDFVPYYVGRGIVNERLKKHLDEGFDDTHFKYSYEADEKASYVIECAGYHYFRKQLRNKIHPRKPDGMEDTVKCPFCGE